MIRAVLKSKTNGRKALILGIDARNVERLVAGDPIFCKSESVGGIGVDVIVLYGETTEAVLDELRKQGFNLPENPELGVMYRGSTEGYHRDDEKKG